MSLSLSAEGTAFASIPQSDPALVNAATFDGGKASVDAGTLILPLDASAGNIDLNTLPDPATLGAPDGVQLVAVLQVRGGVVSFTDPVTGLTMNHVNKVGESHSLVADLTSNQWIYSF
jgi:hypothetical protein